MCFWGWWGRIKMKLHYAQRIWNGTILIAAPLSQFAILRFIQSGCHWGHVSDPIIHTYTCYIESIDGITLCKHAVQYKYSISTYNARKVQCETSSQSWILSKREGTPKWFSDLLKRQQRRPQLLLSDLTTQQYRNVGLISKPYVFSTRRQSLQCIFRIKTNLI